MNIFLSWSGTQSKALAQAFKGWIPEVLQSAKLFISSEDIKAGERWLSKLNATLNDYDFGIVCLTKTNLEASWIQFESGALAKKLDKARIVPVLCEISQSELRSNPLTQFQSVALSKEGVSQLISSINEHIGDNRRTPEQLKTSLDKWWPDFEVKMKEIFALTEGEPKRKFDIEAAMEELLLTVRTLARQDQNNSTVTALATHLFPALLENKNTLSEILLARQLPSILDGIHPTLTIKNNEE
jgi:hypothetical protein